MWPVARTLDADQLAGFGAGNAVSSPLAIARSDAASFGSMPDGARGRVPGPAPVAGEPTRNAPAAAAHRYARRPPHRNGFHHVKQMLAGIGLALGLTLSTWAHASEILLETFRSAAIGRDYVYTVYLPDAYRGGTQNFPVLYLLHGAGGDENEWLHKGGLRETMDALIARQRIQPMIVVMPGHAQAWWVDGAGEKGETALLREAIPHAESKYRIDARRAARLVAGLSAGGYGALNLAFKHPQVFAAAAILSPAIYDPLPPDHSSARRNHPFQRDGQFDPVLWKSLMYTQYLDAYKARKTIVPLYILAGDHDSFGIALQAAMLYERLRLHQPGQVELRILDGDHEWALWRDGLADALQFMNARIAGTR